MICFSGPDSDQAKQPDCKHRKRLPSWYGLCDAKQGVLLRTANYSRRTKKRQNKSVPTSDI